MRTWLSAVVFLVTIGGVAGVYAEGLPLREDKAFLRVLKLHGQIKAAAYIQVFILAHIANKEGIDFVRLMLETAQESYSADLAKEVQDAATMFKSNPTAAAGVIDYLNVKNQSGQKYITNLRLILLEAGVSVGKGTGR